MQLHAFWNGAGQTIAPSPCPGVWTQIDLEVPVGNGEQDYYRTCISTTPRSVMYFHGFYNGVGQTKVPAVCPAGWTQAALEVPIGNGAQDYYRTCFK